MKHSITTLIKSSNTIKWLKFKELLPQVQRFPTPSDLMPRHKWPRSSRCVRSSSSLPSNLRSGPMLTTQATTSTLSWKNSAAEKLSRKCWRSKLNFTPTWHQSSGRASFTSSTPMPCRTCRCWRRSWTPPATPIRSRSMMTSFFRPWAFPSTTSWPISRDWTLTANRIRISAVLLHVRRFSRPLTCFTSLVCHLDPTWCTTSTLRTSCSKVAQDT